MHSAAMAGMVHVIDYFIQQRGVSVDVRAQRNWHMIHDAAMHGQVSVLRRLLCKYKVDLGIRDMFGNHCIREAAGMSHTQVIRYLVDEVGVCVNKDGVDTFGLLPGAVANDRLYSLKFLLNTYEFNVGQSVSIVSLLQGSLVHCAATHSSLKIMQYLLEVLGLDVNERNVLDKHKHALHYAVTIPEGYRLKESKSKVANRALRMAEYLVHDYKVDVNVVDCNGVHPLHLACESDYTLPLVKYLVEELNIDVDIEDKEGLSPLYHALQAKCPDIALFLISKDVIIPYKAEDVARVLRWSVRHDCMLPVLQYFVEELCRDVKGLCLVCEAVVAGSVFIFEYMLDDLHMDIVIGQSTHEHSLHLAARHGQIDILKCLIEKRGIDQSLEDLFGRSAIQIAEQEGHLDVICYLANAPVGNDWDAL